jgi:hypothetical protein
VSHVSFAGVFVFFLLVVVEWLLWQSNISGFEFLVASCGWLVQAFVFWLCRLPQAVFATTNL